EISFNYLGQFDSPGEGPGHLTGRADNPLFQFSRLGAGESFSGRSGQLHTLGFTGIMAAGKLTISLTYNRHEYDKNTIRLLLKGIKRNLVDIIRHCSQKQQGELTPSDVADVLHLSLSPREFQGILDFIAGNIAEKPAIEAIYPLNPMQKGILYHWLTRTRYDTYFIQNLFRVK
ncbi:MAG: hypothetical protein GY940_21715, partial [bacterium]|nr:hypothetical protein [bacterium]